MDHRDIHAAIVAKDLREVERAYRAIVEYPQGDDLDAGSPEHLMTLLGDVTTFLRHDTSIMPSETCEAANMRPGSTYADAATDFVSHKPWWVSRFQQVMGGR